MTETSTLGSRTGVRGGGGTGASRPLRVLGSDTSYSTSLISSVSHTGEGGKEDIILLYVMSCPVM